MLQWLQRRGGAWLQTGGRRWRAIRERSGSGALYECFEVEEVHSKTGELRWRADATGVPPKKGRWTFPDGRREYERATGYIPFPGHVPPWDEDGA